VVVEDPVVVGMAQPYGWKGGCGDGRGRSG